MIPCEVVKQSQKSFKIFNKSFVLLDYDLENGT